MIWGIRPDWPTPYIYIERERERAIQKKGTEQKGERESIQYKKKEGNTVEKK